jgi:undecaprenyl-phosphate 4-deoxy-4-formamido-L-arabinose transferase
MTPDISVVIPVYNEEEGLPLLFERLYAALDALGRPYEIVFVDDGSSDRSVAELREQFQRRPDVTRVVVLARNAGQHLAILAAFEQARGTYVITLDADLQNPPEEIARLVAAMDAGADYVGTVRVSRQDVLWRKAASRLMNRLREGTTSIRITDQGCMLRGYHRNVIDAVNRCTEASTYVPALAYTFARHPVEIEVTHAERTVGQSKYSLFRLVRLNFDLMTGFSVAPLQFFSMSGIVIALLSLCFVLYLAVRRVIVGPEAEGLFTLFGIAFFLNGVALIGLGVVGEYIGRIYEQVRRRPRFTVAAVLQAGDGGAPAQLSRPEAAEAPAALGAPQHVRGTME